jgi:hypothetical protein
MRKCAARRFSPAGISSAGASEGPSRRALLCSGGAGSSVMPKCAVLQATGIAGDVASSTEFTQCEADDLYVR